MDPIRTMFNARAARAGIAVEEAREALKNFSTFAPEIKTRVVTLELNGYGYPLPLGWRLSPVTRHLISYHNGSERHCKVEQPSSCAALEVPADNASCAKKCIYDQLR